MIDLEVNSRAVSSGPHTEPTQFNVEDETNEPVSGTFVNEPDGAEGDAQWSPDVSTWPEAIAEMGKLGFPECVRNTVLIEYDYDEEFVDATC